MKIVGDMVKFIVELEKLVEEMKIVSTLRKKLMVKLDGMISKMKLESGNLSQVL